MQTTQSQRTNKNGGGNLTGVQSAPERSEKLIEGASTAEPSMEGGTELADTERAEYIGEGFPIGFMPGVSVAEEEDAGSEAVSMALFLDKLSERLAFERMGTRLYDGLINKCETLSEPPMGGTLDEVREIREEEHRHFLLLNDAVTKLGGDPTVMSPSANVAAVASQGIMQVIMDPRTSIAQSLQVILTAELTDTAGWDMLCELADELGHSDLADEFRQAWENEEKHVMNIQSWLSNTVMARAAG